MRAAERWPWEPVMVALYRERVFPYLCEKLPDPEGPALPRRDRSRGRAPGRRLLRAAPPGLFHPSS